MYLVCSLVGWEWVERGGSVCSCSGYLTGSGQELPLLLVHDYMRQVYEYEVDLVLGSAVYLVRVVWKATRA